MFDYRLYIVGSMVEENLIFVILFFSGKRL